MDLDDDFDWDAAVAEIDDVCLRSQKAATAVQPDPPTGGATDIDPATAATWIYPANIPCRQYQFCITQTALFTNTLVSLPTGLGKTLIAAVVMYNYYRWFPSGKIVFTAPSRPLVMQQIEACHNIMGIPQEMTIDMTGQMSPPQRAEQWQGRRVFFVTPQCLEKDINSGTCPMMDIVCLVVDEAHRATGNFSYCMVTRELLAANAKLRILALTATPGSKQVTIQAVVDNLHISCLEYRDENDPDVSQYTHSRKLEIIQVAMNAESNKIKDIFLEILMPVVDRLCKFGVFYSREVARLSPFEFITARDKFRQAPPPSLAENQYREVETSFSLAITLYHIFKLMHSHGIRPALEMLQAKLQEGTLRMLARNNRLHEIKILMQESVGHGAPSPKLEKMEEIILLHFNQHDPMTTRVIIFTNYRESVKDILEALSKIGHIVKAMEFIGQSSGKASKGQTQKVQQAVLQKFRAGGYNTIVATSIAEEGLDIMEVDLVICFDANISPLRMIQRMGRTGRKRDGRVALVLASEGSEMQGYIRKQAKNKALSKHMRHGGVSSFNFHPSPRMIPHTWKPEVQMTEMKIEQYVPRGKKQCAEGALDPESKVDELTEEEQALLQKHRLPLGAEPWKASLIAFPRYQLLPTPIYAVKHSSRTIGMFIDILRGLQEPAFLAATKECLPSQLALSSFENILPSGARSMPSAGYDHSAGGILMENAINDGNPMNWGRPDGNAEANLDPVCEANDDVLHRLDLPLADRTNCYPPVLSPFDDTTLDPDEAPLIMVPDDSMLPVQQIDSHFSDQFYIKSRSVIKYPIKEVQVVSPLKTPPRECTATLDDAPTEFFIAATPEDRLPQTASFQGFHEDDMAGETFVSPVPNSCRAVKLSSSSPILETPIIPNHEVTPPCTSKPLPPLPKSCNNKNLPIASVSKGHEIFITLQKPLKSPKTEDSVSHSETRRHLSCLRSQESSQSPAKPKALNFSDCAPEVAPFEVLQNGKPSIFLKLPVTETAVITPAQQIDSSKVIVDIPSEQIRLCRYERLMKANTEFQQRLQVHSPEQQVGSVQVVCTALPPSPLSNQSLQCKGSKGQPSNTEFQERLRVRSPNQHIGSPKLVHTANSPSPLLNQGLQCKGSKGQPSNTEFQERLQVHSPNQQIGSPKLFHTAISPSPPLNEGLQCKGSKRQPSNTEFQERLQVHSPNQQIGSPKLVHPAISPLPPLNQGLQCKGSKGQPSNTEFQERLQVHSPNQQIGSPKLVHTAVSPLPPLNKVLKWKGSEGQPSKTQFQERLQAYSPDQQFGSLKLVHTAISPSPPIKRVSKWTGSKGQPSKTQFQERFHVHSPNQQSGSLKAAPIALSSSPVSNQGSKCKGGEGQDLLIQDTPPSEQRKPRTFKRLKKARELLPSSASKERADNPGCLAKKSKILQEKRSKLGKVQRKFTVQPFIDDEAEESSDEDNSTDDSEADSEDETQDGFIDPSHTQHLHGSVDMMAIYRRSLLTQSPLGGGSITPTATTSVTLGSSETGGSHSKQSIEPGSVSRVSYSAPTPTHKVNVTLPGHTFKCPGSSNEVFSEQKDGTATSSRSLLKDQDTLTIDDGKLDTRKRKLSFQIQEDDDLFAGLDLDALEEEATNLARARSTQATCSSIAMPSFDLGIDG